MWKVGIGTDVPYKYIMGSLAAGRSHRMMIDNSSTERVEEFKYLGTNLTNRNYVEE